MCSDGSKFHRVATRRRRNDDAERERTFCQGHVRSATGLLFIKNRALSSQVASRARIRQCLFSLGGTYKYGDESKRIVVYQEFVFLCLKKQLDVIERG